MSKIESEYKKKKYQVDMHTHTIASGHAKNTIDEMVDEAIKRGLVLYGITDHSMLMPGTCEEEYFLNLPNIDKSRYDIDLRLGVELNIIDSNGNVDMKDSTLKLMDIVIASIHNTIGYTCGSRKENTLAIIGAMKNPYIDIIGHPDDGKLPMDYKEIVKAAREYGKLLEINENSLSPGGFRENSRENIMTILDLCANSGVPVIIDSDAHSIDRVGNHEYAIGMMEEMDFPIELVINYFSDKMKDYLALRH